jgi:transposase InsO family protein
MKFIPDTVVTDNGKQFVSVEFERFLADCDIRHVKASLYYPQSNGLVERFNRSEKQAVRTALAEGKPVEEGVRNMLITYRSTAQPATGVSPSEAHVRQADASAQQLICHDSTYDRQSALR